MTLKRIILQDFVIVQTLDLEWQKGFTVLTGETGAGKSIMLDALQLVLGARSDAQVIREGCNQTDICAEFDCPPHLHAWLEEAGFVQEQELLLRRVIDTQGRSRAWINGSPATATQLRHLGEQLVDIHGQHAWQSLTRPDSARSMLDTYGCIDTSALKALWQSWNHSSQALNQALSAQDNLQRERDRLQWQISELDKLSPRAEEWDELNAQHTRLSHAQTLMDAAQTCLHLLEDDDSGAASPLGKAHHLLQDQEHLEPQFQGIADVLGSCVAQLHDARYSLQAYLRHADLDPELLADMDTRLSFWMQLARRYKRPPEELPALLDRWKQELRQLDAAVDIDGLQAAEQADHQKYLSEARHISQQRTLAAPRLSRAITQSMQTLGMKGGRFEVQLEQADTASPAGMDNITFLVAAHTGATPKPIAKVASGGELSRISLAIAVTTSELGQAGTLIFDEVDSGVGGAVAETVGRLMHSLGYARQVLAVTHLPQVAAYADQHYRVTKRPKSNTTISSVDPLSGEEREMEMARMLGGEYLSEATMTHAREMLSMARLSSQEQASRTTLEPSALPARRIKATATARKSSS